MQKFSWQKIKLPKAESEAITPCPCGQMPEIMAFVMQIPGDVDVFAAEFVYWLECEHCGTFADTSFQRDRAVRIWNGNRLTDWIREAVQHGEVKLGQPANGAASSQPGL